jgi:hypothetical protein
MVDGRLHSTPADEALGSHAQAKQVTRSQRDELQKLMAEL